MSTEKFRRQLRDETEQWWRDGFIDATFYQQLAERYQFSEIEASTSNRFITILLGLGGILLGLGAITFVAANWQDWPRALRVVLLFSLFAGVNGAGFYLWRRPLERPRWQRLGHGLLLTGALVLGANLGLMSQMFHQSGQSYELFLIWGLGVLVMAYFLRLTSLGVLSWILINISYLNWFIWGKADFEIGTWIYRLMLYLPLLITPLFLPLAHWCRSRALYGLWGASFALLFGLSWDPINAWTIAKNPWGIAWATTLPPALLWIYHSRFWQWPMQQTRSTPHKKRSFHQGQRDPFQAVGQSLAIWFLSLVTYWFSFRWLWSDSWLLRQLGDGVATYSWFSFTLLGYGAIAAYGWWQWATIYRHRSTTRSLWMTAPTLVGVLGLMWGVFFFHLQGATFSIIGPAAMNFVLFFIAVTILHDGLLLGLRHRFWGGMSLLVIGLISRMFEYNTGLILKAIVLSLCGLGIIAAGLWFESRTKSPTQPIAVLSEKTS